MEPLIRLTGWGGAATMSVAVTGVEWLTQPVELPLGALLLVALLPVETLVSIVRYWGRKIGMVPPEDEEQDNA